MGFPVHADDLPNQRTVTKSLWLNRTEQRFSLARSGDLSAVRNCLQAVISSAVAGRARIFRKAARVKASGSSGVLADRALASSLACSTASCELPSARACCGITVGRRQ